MTGSIPFQNIKKDSAIVISVTQGRLPEIASNEHIGQIQTLSDIMERCWAIDRFVRPCADQCVATLARMGRIPPSKRGIYENSDAHITERLISVSSRNCINGKLDEAIACLKQAVKLSGLLESQALLEDQSALVTCVDNVVQDVSQIETATDRLDALNLGQNEFTQAANLHKKPSEIFMALKCEKDVADLIRRLGRVYHARDEFSKAQAAFKAAKDVYEYLGRHPDVTETRALSDVLKVEAVGKRPNGITNKALDPGELQRGSGPLLTAAYNRNDAR
ncbi:hypothetical protein FRB90_007714, partial [Tulasnella sp. 427]